MKIDNQLIDVPHRGFIIQVDSVAIWVSFMAFIKEQQRRNFSDGLCLPEWVYRGQSNSLWKLSSSFERQFGCTGDEAELRRIELASLETFRELSNGSERTYSNAELLAHMQHYGVPTRLVDFTRAPLIALYFALNDGVHPLSNDSFSVWATHLNAANSWYDKENRLKAACRSAPSVKSIHVAETDSTRVNNLSRIQCERRVFEGFCENEDEMAHIRDRIAMFCYAPTTPNPRMNAQRGLFLASTKLSRSFELSFYEWKYFEHCCFEYEERPLSAIFKDHQVEPGYIANADAFKFDFAPSMRDEARAYLEVANVRSSIVFPDFEGIAKEVKEEMRLYKRQEG